MYVLCIDDKNKPRQIADENWVKEGEKYTVESTEKLALGGTGYILKEVKFPKYFLPAVGWIGSYRSVRFIVVQEGPGVEAEEEIELELANTN